MRGNSYGNIIILVTGKSSYYRKIHHQAAFQSNVGSIFGGNYHETVEEICHVCDFSFTDPAAQDHHLVGT